VVNPHKAQIEKIMLDIKHNRSPKYNIVFSPETTDAMIVDLLSIGFFTNLIRTSFTASYVKKYKCTDCREDATNRCHGQDEERPVLLRKALEVVRKNPKFGGAIPLRELTMEFFNQHIATSFTFKCHSCHKKEPKSEAQLKIEAERRAEQKIRLQTKRDAIKSNVKAKRITPKKITPKKITTIKKGKSVLQP
jgi:hypothetical protein